MVCDYHVQFYEKMFSYSTEYLGQFFFKLGYSISYKVRLHSKYVGLLERSWKKCERESYTLCVFVEKLRMNSKSKSFLFKEFGCSFIIS